jgi:alkylation response protein AidB-like acyl-CoA dehydrogenase
MMNLSALDEKIDSLAVASRLAKRFADEAVERDRRGGTPKLERDLIRESQLLRLSIPKAWGGLGASWPEVYRTVRVISAVDGSLGQVYGFHHVLLATCFLFGSNWQAQRLLVDSALKNWFWGNALNPLDARLSLIRGEGEIRLRGQKSYCTGAIDSDYLIVSAVEEGTGRLVVAAIPTGRAGITLNGDWEGMGQRLTDSGTASFADVVLEEDEILGPPGPMGTPFASLRPCVAQLLFVNVYIGITEGALAAAGEYTRERTRAWPWSGVDKASDDPYVLERFGNAWADLEAARATADKAAENLQVAWANPEQVTPERRGRVALEVATAKVLSSRAAVSVTSEMFEATGPGATAARWGFDRFWRNARTLTLHDRLDYKVKELGQWALNGKVPTPSLYS